MEQEVQILLVSTLEELQNHADNWNKLAFQSPQALPMLSAAWVIAYLTHCLAPLDRWTCLFAYLTSGRLVGVLPVIISPHHHFGSSRPNLHTPWDWHTISGDALLANGVHRPIFEMFLNKLETISRKWFCLELKHVKEGSPTLALVKEKFQRFMPLQDLESFGSFLVTTGSFETYRAQLSRNFQNNLRKAQRKLSQLPEPRFVFLTGDAAGLTELDRFFEIEASGWKGREGTAVLCSETLVSFYRDVCQQLSKLGWLELHFLEADGRTIAAHLAVKTGRSLVLLRIAYDEAYEKCAPGNLLFEQTVQRAFETSDVDEINCLTDMAWHKNWRMEKRNYGSARFYPCKVLPFCLDYLPRKTIANLHRIPALQKTSYFKKKILKGIRK